MFAVCNSSATLGDPDPNDDVVTVKYDSVMAQINLKENYPVETEPYIRIAVFNCDGTSNSLFWHIYMFCVIQRQTTDHSQTPLFLPLPDKERYER